MQVPIMDKKFRCEASGVLSCCFRYFSVSKQKVLPFVSIASCERTLLYNSIIDMALLGTHKTYNAILEKINRTTSQLLIYICVIARHSNAFGKFFETECNYFPAINYLK